MFPWAILPNISLQRVYFCNPDLSPFRIKAFCRNCKNLIEVVISEVGGHEKECK